MNIELITTGGTIDKVYNPLSGKLTFGNSNIPEIIKRARVTANIHITPLMAIDSLQMTDEHRNQILGQCQTSDTDRLVITHGTDTMTDTAKVLASANLVKTIVLTGSMIPFSIQHSDALFNLGAAITSAQLLEPGIYIAMNGKVFNALETEKNRQQGIFETN
ncbi:L-asparaginase 1 [BD1-7 clade bacterium]|uniref:L-asparaginase 1 n=1 Tax=BD1-7 clade bacterium TaxID=2029982 RepID=A0A5S9NU56_9GAMM|nr:L-asparaginase 1 [BD1-7 clade bacterium]CAA0094146.1 L-asparaginase 1 [BD1-7 clade bacterium]